MYKELTLRAVVTPGQSDHYYCIHPEGCFHLLAYGVLGMGKISTVPLDDSPALFGTFFLRVHDLTPNLIRTYVRMYGGMG